MRDSERLLREWGGTEQYEIVKGLTYNFPPYRMGDFIIGICLGILFWQKPGERKQPGRFRNALDIVTLILVAGIEAFVYWHSRIIENSWCRSTVLVEVPAVLLVLTYARADGCISSRLGKNRFLIWFGNISAYGFLIHEMIARYLVAAGNHFLHIAEQPFLWRAGYRGLVLVMTFALTVLACRVWEKAEKLRRLQGIYPGR